MTALWLSSVLFVLAVLLGALWFWLPRFLPVVERRTRPRKFAVPRALGWFVVVGGSVLLLGALLLAAPGFRGPALALLCGWGMGLASVLWLRAPTARRSAAAQSSNSSGLLDAVPLAIAEIDADRRVVQVNQALLDMLETSRRAFATGTPVSRLVHLLAERCIDAPEESQQRALDADLGGGTDLLESLLQRGQLDDDGFVRIPAVHGRFLGLRLQALPAGGWLILVADLSERQRLENKLREIDQATYKEVDRRTRELRLARQEAEQANVSRTRFLTAASHDLLQPMNAARLLAGSLADHNSADAEVTSTARRIEEAIVAAESILDALLEAGRLDAAAVKPRLAVVTLARIFESLNAQFAPVAARRKLKLRLRPTVLQVHSDPVLLQRLLSNLLSNALRYTPSGGVLVAARRRGDNVLIQVFDTGLGIDPAQQQLIFHEFRTGQHESPWGERGLGLGLALCRRTANLLEHDFGVRSLTERGSCFYLSAPFAGRLGRMGKVVAEVPASSPLAQLRVLCIDDDTDSLAALCGLLRRWGAVVGEATDYRRAREQLIEFEPQVLLVDYLLDTDLDGFDVITELRRLSQKELPAAVVSATRSDFLRDQAESKRCELFLKPVKPALLKAWLSLLLTQ